MLSCIRRPCRFYLFTVRVSIVAVSRTSTVMFGLGYMNSAAIDTYFSSVPIDDRLLSLISVTSLIAKSLNMSVIIMLYYVLYDGRIPLSFAWPKDSFSKMLEPTQSYMKYR